MAEFHGTLDAAEYGAWRAGLLKKGRIKRWLNNWIWRYRLWRERCPYCAKDRQWAELFDGKVWQAASLCPDLHFGFLLSFDYKAEGWMVSKFGPPLQRQMLGVGGRPMPIPSEHIRWREERSEP